MDGRKICRYREFPIYIKLRKFRKMLRLLLNSLPSSEERRLKDQGLRAINSTCLNIAEGSNKPSDKEFAQFINRSLTSLEEVSSVLDLCFDDQYLNQDKYSIFNHELLNIAEELLKFERSLRKTIR